MNPASHETNTLLAEVDASSDRIAEITQRLVRIPSEMPPSNTVRVVDELEQILKSVPGAQTTRHMQEHPVENLVAVLRSGIPGKRLVLNGHLDTYPPGDRAAWSYDPLSGEIHDGKLYGRGAADMKGGVACALIAFELLARHCDKWAGELVLTLAGDEERMGELGTKYLLDTVPEASGDAMICTDVGSPRVPRIGEKGMIWMDLHATGRSAHAAHVHRGSSAIDRLREAMDALATLRRRPVELPEEVRQTIEAAKPVSEPLSGDGESKVLSSVTVNFGRIDGGRTRNLIADAASLTVDIRLPNGTTLAEIETEVARLLAPIDDITYETVCRYEPTWTDPQDPIVQAVCAASEAVLGGEVRPNGRIGGSDARLYRAASIPTVVCGLTPNNLGAADEYAELDELVDLAKIVTHAALSFLAPA